MLTYATQRNINKSKISFSPFVSCVSVKQACSKYQLSHTGESWATDAHCCADKLNEDPSGQGPWGGDPSNKD